MQAFRGARPMERHRLMQSAFASLPFSERTALNRHGHRWRDKLRLLVVEIFNQVNQRAVVNEASR